MATTVTPSKVFLEVCWEEESNLIPLIKISECCQLSWWCTPNQTTYFLLGDNHMQVFMDKDLMLLFQPSRSATK